MDREFLASKAADVGQLRSLKNSQRASRGTTSGMRALVDRKDEQMESSDPLEVSIVSVSTVASENGVTIETDNTTSSPSASFAIEHPPSFVKQNACSILMVCSGIAVSATVIYLGMTQSKPFRSVRKMQHVIDGILP